MTPGIAYDSTGTGPRVVLVHGFTQTAGSLRQLATALGAEHEVLSVDAPGHGHSTGVVASDLAGTAAAIAEVGGRATYLGYSMGGRICLQLALDHPALVRALVLVSTSAGIEDPAERASRRTADLALARRLDPGGEGAAALSIDEFLEEWLSGPLFSHLSVTQRGLGWRRMNTPAGLAASLRSIGAGAMDPLWDRLGELRIPTLVVAGAGDPRYADIGRRMVAAIGNRSALAIVAGAGHSVPSEQPAELARLVGDFLRAVRQQSDR